MNSDERCLVDGPDEFANWDIDSRRELIDLFLRQMSLESLAEHFDASIREIVRELSKLMLSVADPYENKFAENFGAKWDLVDEDRLRVLYGRGLSVAELAKSLKRDRLGVCFRILRNFDVVVPQQTRQELKLDEFWEAEAFPDESSREQRECVVCGDVILYCKCSFHDWESS